MTAMVVYDDTNAVPDSIRGIIGANCFGDIVHRRQRTADTVSAIVQSLPGCQFDRIIDAAQRTEYVKRLRKLPERTMIFRMPSSTVALSADGLRALLAKLPYALGSVFYGDPAQCDVPVLLRRDEMITVLDAHDPEERRRLLVALESRAIKVPVAGDLLDIADLARFLSFMSGATETRHFNQMKVESGIFRKYSRDRDKMKGEYRFFHVADEAMKRFLLPTFDYREDEDGASYAMEHMSLPDAAMQICHRTFDEAGFARLLDNFFAFIAVRGQAPVGIDAVRAAAQGEIVDKLDARIARLMATPTGIKLNALLIADDPAGGILDLAARCRTALQRAFARSRLDHLAFGHGDPCLSNILFNTELNLFRLIDPRGAQTREAGFMHPAYDLAKFSHSVVGGYDFVNSGLAECSIDGNLQLSLRLADGGPPAWMRHAFFDRLETQGWDVGLIRAIEASLFLSMLPLHLDMAGKLPAFALIARNILNELDASP
jgi:hypothetical protein